jgi:predicted transglutaminase-like cysteine proteinase
VKSNLALLAGVLLLSASGDAMANTPADRSLSGDTVLGAAQSIGFGASAAVPVGYYQLCKKQNSVCIPTQGKNAHTASGAVVLTPALSKQLLSVNAEVNGSIRPETDMQQFGVADRWSVSPRRGDCEDYALTKKARLLGKGWPSSALLIALAVTPQGEEHAVLIARTDHGDFVLDNLTSAVRGWTPTLYRWKTVQSPTAEWVWNTITTGRTVEVASNAPPKLVVQPEPAGSVKAVQEVASRREPVGQVKVMAEAAPRPAPVSQAKTAPEVDVVVSAGIPAWTSPASDTNRDGATGWPAIAWASLSSVDGSPVQPFGFSFTQAGWRFGTPWFAVAPVVVAPGPTEWPATPPAFLMSSAAKRGTSEQASQPQPVWPTQLWEG